MRLFQRHLSFKQSSVALCVSALSLPVVAQSGALDAVVITAPKPDGGVDSAHRLDLKDLSQSRIGVTDSTQLLRDIPGVSIYSAGGISGLPAIHGLADDRLRIQIDGADWMAACPNHMNSALSYIAPDQVGSITVYSGMTPVSVGGDSLGGTIQIKSAPPTFAQPGQAPYVQGQAGGYYRSNGRAKGLSLNATWVGEQVNLSYSESHAQADNYKAGGSFKPEATARNGASMIGGDVVGSSAYSGSVNREIGLAMRQQNHLIQVTYGEQRVGFEGFPNQRMDMTGNKNTLFNLRYTGQYEWGELLARYSEQDVKHRMDMGPDRTSAAMPMDTKAHTRNALLQANVNYSERDIVRLGAEYQTYSLYDWWPPTSGTMGPNEFWNIDYGRRDKVDFFAEWEASWNAAWTSLVGLRSNRVATNAGPVMGYDNSLAMWGDDAAAFNAKGRRRVDQNWDFTALLRYRSDESSAYEAGYARKSRSPSLYQRYPWSTNAMADLMNNFVGDGNGYIGNLDLKPEVAHTLSATGQWSDAPNQHKTFRATVYYTRIDNYIDAQRCGFGQCGTQNLTATSGFVHLQYVNQTADLYGADLSGQWRLGQVKGYGEFLVAAQLNHVRGKNQVTGDNLYNIMPINSKLSLTQRLEGWTNVIELAMVNGKKNVSSVRNEIPTDGYSLLNLRSSYEWKRARLDLGIDNVLDRYYQLPLGGAYVGQGNSMTTQSSTIPWGRVVPGMGRSIYTAFKVYF